MERIADRIRKAVEGTPPGPEVPDPDTQVTLQDFGADLSETRRSRSTGYIPVSASDLPSFEDPFTDQAVQTLCGAIIAAESPIEERHLIATFSRVTGIRRLSPRQKEAITVLIRRLFVPVRKDGFVTYWR